MRSTVVVTLRSSMSEYSDLGFRGRHDGERSAQFPDDPPASRSSFLFVAVDARQRGADELPGGHLAQRLDLLSRGTSNRHDVPRCLGERYSQPVSLPAALFDFRTSPALVVRNLARYAVLPEIDSPDCLPLVRRG